MVFECSLRRIFTAAVLLSAIFSSTLTFAEEKSERPKIGLALSGGGAKGAAHIGVLKALEEMHIPVDYIAGTSMGAYVGGLYAAGMSADEIEVLIDTIEWNQGYQDRESRADRRVHSKASDDRYNIQASIGYEGTKIKTPQGIVQGQYMKRILRESTGTLPALKSFDDLVIPFRAVATDIENLGTVVIDKGVLTKAMLASMSVPGALPPVKLDGKLLVDGGSVNNMPVDIVKAMGADIVIAVDISTDYAKADNLKTFYQVSNQLINFLVRNTTKAQIANLSDKDVLLTPAVGDMETADFDRMPEALQKGYQITRLSEASLKPLKVDSAVYQGYVERKQARRKLLEFGDQMTISDVVINNNTSLSDEVLKDRLDVELGLLDTAKLEESISNLNALDRFESVDFEIHKNDGSNALFLDVEERSWGPSFLDFRVNIEDDFSTSTLYSAGVRITNTGLSEYGAELMTELELGNRKVAGVELFAPLVASQEFFIRPWGKYIAEQVTQYDLTDDEKKIDEQESVIILTSRTKEWRMGAELGWQPELWSQFSVGADFVVGEETRGGALFRREFSQDKQYISITLDTLDNRVFPSSGSYFHAQLSSVTDTVLDNQLFEKVIDSNQVEVELSHAQSIGRHTLFGELSYQGTDVDRAAAITSFGFDTGELVVRLRELGGLFNLSGLPQGRLRGDNSAFGSLIYRYRLQDNDFGLFKTPVYVGASIERGSVWNNPDFSIKDIPFYNAGSIFAGVDTIIGPVLVAYGITDSEHDSFYLSLGTQF